jgi:hypothetical protein
MKIHFLLFLTLLTHTLFAQTDSLQQQRDSLFTQTDSLRQQQDSLFTVLGDTLVGQITVDKDNNQYLFKSTTVDSLTLSPTKIKRFILFSKDNNNELQIYDAIFDKFYFLELGENDIITLYATHLYNKITNDGPTYYTISRKYCVRKNNIIFNIRPESLKSDLLILTADCSNVVKKIKAKKIGLEELAAFITEYNHCFVEKK